MVGLKIMTILLSYFSTFRCVVSRSFLHPVFTGPAHIAEGSWQVAISDVIFLSIIKSHISIRFVNGFELSNEIAQFTQQQRVGIILLSVLWHFTRECEFSHQMIGFMTTCLNHAWLRYELERGDEIDPHFTLDEVFNNFSVSVI